MHRLLPWTAAVAIAALIAWAFWPKPVPVDLAEIGPRTIDVSVEEEGTSRIRDVYVVSATIAGKLRRIDLHPGDPVTAGETVVAAIGPASPALLDARARSVAEATEQAAAAAVQLAQAEVTQARARLNFARSDAARARQLFERNAISERGLDSATLEAETAAGALASAAANLTVRQRELESARAVLAAGDAPGADHCCVDIRAPVSGRVLRVLTESEQVVQPGTPLVELGDPADMEVETELLSRDAVRVAAGAAAEITGWGGPPLKAVVRRVEPSAETQVSALGIEEQRVKVILDLAGDPKTWALLGHDYRVIVRITLWRGENLVAVPVGALFRDGPDWAVYVVVDGRAYLRAITLGERNDDFAEVREGLATGDQVVLHPSDLVADGVRVTPRE